MNYAYAFGFLEADQLQQHLQALDAYIDEIINLRTDKGKVP